VSTGNLENKRCKERCTETKESIYNEEENKAHTFLRCKETQMWTENSLSDEWLHTNDVIAHKKIISYTKYTGFKNYLIFDIDRNLSN
jgi:hypothetical protein